MKTQTNTIDTCGHDCKKLRQFGCVACDDKPKTKVKTIQEIIPKPISE
ncbi:hypothetical protein [Emticicia sp. W12TSBA100-4]